MQGTFGAFLAQYPLKYRTQLTTTYTKKRLETMTMAMPVVESEQWRKGIIRVIRGSDGRDVHVC